VKEKSKLSHELGWQWKKAPGSYSQRPKGGRRAMRKQTREVGGRFES